MKISFAVIIFCLVAGSALAQYSESYTAPGISGIGPMVAPVPPSISTNLNLVKPLEPSVNIPSSTQMVPPPPTAEREEPVECEAVDEKCEELCFPLPGRFPSYNRCVRTLCTETSENCLEKIVEDLRNR